MQGDFTDPLYFDYISFAQHAVIGREMPKGLQVFKVRESRAARAGVRSPPVLHVQAPPVLHAQGPSVLRVQGPSVLRVQSP